MRQLYFFLALNLKNMPSKIKTINKKIFLLGLAALSAGLAILFLNFPDQAKGQGGDTSCDTEIPIGEAMEQAVTFTGTVRNSIFSSEQLIDDEIDKIKNLISAVQRCDPNKCDPVCYLVPHTSTAPGAPGQGPVTVTTYTCEHDACTGEICPVSSINSAYQQVEAVYNSIVGVQESTKTYTGKKDYSWKYGSQNYNDQSAGGIVTAMLKTARESFSGCFLTSDEWNQYQEGKITGKIISTCPEAMILGRELPDECKIVCNTNPPSDACYDCMDCKSPGNFFCCDLK